MTAFVMNIIANLWYIDLEATFEKSREKETNHEFARVKPVGMTQYKNHEFGIFTLLGDKLAWVGRDGQEGMLDLTNIYSVWLGEQSTGGTSGVGQAPLTGVIDGTVLKTIPGKPPANPVGESGLWAMKIRKTALLVNIYCNPTMKDDPAAFANFVRELHKNIAKFSPSPRYVGGGVLNLLVFIFLSLILLVLGSGTAFVGKATGLHILIPLGGVFALSALALFLWGMRTSKPKAYDPNAIPDKLLP